MIRRKWGQEGRKGREVGGGGCKMREGLKKWARDELISGSMNIINWYCDSIWENRIRSRKLLRRWCLKMRRETYRNRPTNITNPSCSRPSTRPSPSAMSCTRSRSLTSCLPLPPPVSFLLPSPPAPPTAPKPYPLSQEQGSRGRPRALSSLCWELLLGKDSRLFLSR